MKPYKKQLIGLLTASLVAIYGYILLNNLFSPDGVEIMRNFYHQGGARSLIVLFEKLSFFDSLTSASIQWGFMLGIVFVAVFARPWLEQVHKWFISLPRFYFLLVLVILAFSGMLAMFYYKYRFFPRAGDANATLFQVKILAKGALTVPSHPLKEFFHSDWIINNGRMYAQYTLGTAFMLLWGYLLGMPWIINPLLGALSLIFIYHTARELYGESIARYGVAIISVTPFYLALPTTYLSHAPQLFFLSIFIYFFLKTIRDKHSSYWHPLLSGMALGMAVNTRTLTALTISLPLLAWGGYLLVKDWKGFYRKTILFLVGLLPFVLALFLINWVQNGHPLLFGMTVYKGQSFVGFSQEWGLREAITTYLFRLQRLSNLLAYSPLSAGVVLVFIALSFIDIKPAHYLLWGFFVITSIGYLPAATTVWQYRYYYTAAVYLMLLFPLGISNLGNWLQKNFKLASTSSLLCIFLIVSVLAAFSAAYRRGLKPDQGVLELRRPYDIAAEANLNNALVFIRNTKCLYPKWYTRNSPDFNDPILWVLDLGERNQELMNYYPERKAYLYDNGEITLYNNSSLK
jgi:hypothetical protein